LAGTPLYYSAERFLFFESSSKTRMVINKAVDLLVTDGDLAAWL
jgi:hypothetical protein